MMNITWRIKDRLLRLTEPWREERASLDLEWKVFARKHNAAGKRPECWYPGMEPDPMEKVVLVDAREVDPNYLRNQYISTADKYDNLRFSKRKYNNRTDN